MRTQGKHRPGHATAAAASSEEVTPSDGAVCIDGSLLEGGGQILRNAAALSAITGRGIYVNKIRAGRKNPGLSPQHLTGLHLVEEICRGRLTGGAVRSTTISLVPGRPAPGDYVADTKTAGSCTLMVQQALPCLLFAGGADHSALSTVTLRGGTDAQWAPPIGYLQHVLLPQLKRLLGAAGAGLELQIQKRGFYPKGGGVAVMQVPSLPPGQCLPSWDLTDRGHLARIDGYVFTAGRVRPEIGRRMAQAAAGDIKQALTDPAVVFGCSSGGIAAAPSGPSSKGSVKEAEKPGSGGSSSVCSVVVDMHVVEEPPERAVCDGGGIVLVAQTSSGCLFGASALAERGVTAEAVGQIAANELLEYLRSGAAVDDWMQDQLIVFMALAAGTSSMLCNEPTLHTRTAISIMEQLLPGVKFTVQQQQQHLYLVRCAGAGMPEQ